MITANELKDMGFAFNEYYQDWRNGDTNYGFNLNENGFVDWIRQHENYHGLQIQPIGDIETFKRFWGMVTGKII